MWNTKLRGLKPTAPTQELADSRNSLRATGGNGPPPILMSERAVTRGLARGTGPAQSSAIPRVFPSCVGSVTDG